MLTLTLMPLWLSALLLVGLTTGLSMLGPVLIRRQISLNRLSTNNEVAGFKFAVVGVLYAVTVAFAIIVVWEKFNEAEMTVAQEAAAIATIHRLAKGAGNDLAAPLQVELDKYIEAVVAQDWPVMESANGRSSPASSQALDALYGTTLAFKPAGSRDTSIQRAILGQLEVITVSRRIRMVLSRGIMPGVVWWVLFGGAVITIAFTFFFGTQNVRAQTFMTGMLTVLIFSAMLIIIAINYPFSGPVRVHPDALELVRTD